MTFLALGLGIASLGIMDLANLICLRTLTPDKALFWQRAALAAEMFFAGNMLLFSISFGKSDANTVLKKWKWWLISLYLISGALLACILFSGESLRLLEPRHIKLSSTALYLHILLLTMSVIALVNFEKTFRSSSGIERWQIKYLLFGSIGIIVFYVYILSQRILYNAIYVNDAYILSIIIFFSNILIMYSILIQKVSDDDIFISRKIIYSYISLITAGVYAIIVAVFVQIVTSFNIHINLKLNILVIFFAFLIFIIIFYKESFRRKAKRAINRHFKKSKYVYRDEWIIFSTELSKKIDTSEICETLIKTLAERIFARNVSLWLFDENESHFFMAGAQNLPRKYSKIECNDLFIDHLKAVGQPVSVSEIANNEKLLPLSEQISALLSETNAEVIVPLILGNRWVGLLTLGEIQTGERYDKDEDYDLLKSVAAHAASSINNAILFEKNLKARELEAFNKLACFVVHDLKNAISMLSMVTENAKIHFCNPEFQEDALQSISAAVARMRKILAGLSACRHEAGTLKSQRTEVNLNKLINETVEEIVRNGFGEIGVDRALESLPRVRVERDEVKKVLENLLLNACEAVNGRGQITIRTEMNGEYVVIKVRDNGPGMSQEFMESSLFRPFVSTKSNGLGIGLYQCKTIVEAYGGKIEAWSSTGDGSEFSVYLPINLVSGESPCLTENQTSYQRWSAIRPVPGELPCEVED